jgi:hypothetical protein
VRRDTRHLSLALLNNRHLPETWAYHDFRKIKNLENGK